MRWVPLRHPLLPVFCRHPLHSFKSGRLSCASLIATSAGSESTSSFTTLAGEDHSAEIEVKKSRFLAWAWPISSPEAALKGLDERRDPSATHNCWAYRLGQQYRSTDDGEPGGTAGRPILSAIESEDLDGVCVLVVRHFGGVKLGTGGLVRAYGGAARACLRAAPRRVVVPRVTVRAVVPYDALGTAYQIAASQGGSRVEEDYESLAAVSGGEGRVVLTLSVDAERAAQLQAALLEASSGRIVAEVLALVSPAL